MDNISSQQTPYYPQAGIDAPLGKWEDIYRNNHSLSAGGGSNGDFSLSSYWHIMIAFLIEKREHVGKRHLEIMYETLRKDILKMKDYWTM